MLLCLGTQHGLFPGLLVPSSLPCALGAPPTSTAHSDDWVALCDSIAMLHTAWQCVEVELFH